MTSTSSIPKKRGSRVTHAQVNFLTEYMMSNTTFALGLYSSLQVKDQQKTLWADLAANLNSLGSAKSVQKWQKVWSEIKSKARLKYQRLRTERIRTGNMSLTDSFSELEKKVLSIIGIDTSDDINIYGSDHENTGTHLSLYEGKVNGVGKGESCSEMISEEVPCEIEAIDSFCIEGEGCSSEDDVDPGTPAGDSNLSGCDSAPQRIGHKRVSSTDVDGPESKRLSSCQLRPAESAEVTKSQHNMLMNLLNSQQEMVQTLLKTQRQVMQDMLISQQKMVQDLQNSQQEIAKSVISFMNRRAEVEERAIRLEEERLKLEERKVVALDRTKENGKNGHSGSFS